MVQSIKIVNLENKKGMEIGTEEPYILDTVSWGSPLISAESYKVPYQIGESLLGVGVGTREPVIIGYIIADVDYKSILGLKVKEYYHRLLENIEEHKVELNKVVNIAQNLRIYVNDLMLDGLPLSPVKYSTVYEENNEVFCKFEIQLKCYNPLFYKSAKTFSFYNLEKKLVFPLVLLGNETIFGILNTKKTIDVVNDGESVTGAKIIIEAITRVDNPDIYKIVSQEHIAFKNIHLNQGDILEINTEIGQEDAYIRRKNTSTNIRVIDSIVSGSTFLQFPQGTTELSYTTDNEVPGEVDIKIELTEKYYNLRNM